jgi:hypothetical protein
MVKATNGHAALQGLVAKAHSQNSSDDPIYYATQALIIFERYQSETEDILKALVRTELTILPALAGKKEQELRKLIWQAHDILTIRKKSHG